MNYIDILLIVWFAANAIAGVALIGKETRYTKASAIFYILVASIFILGIIKG